MQAPEVKALVEQRIAEKAMAADEVLLRLAEQARAEQSEYLRSDGNVDLERLLGDGKGHLIKGTSWDSKGNLVISFYDAQAALVHLGKYLGLFTDRIQVVDEDWDPEKWREKQERQLRDVEALDGPDNVE